MSSATSTSSRQAFFSRFSHRAVEALASTPRCQSSKLPLVLLTGGLRTPAQLRKALSLNHAQLLGFGRGSVLSPGIPEILKRPADARVYREGVDRDDLVPFSPEPDLVGKWPWTWFWSWVPKIPLVGAGVEMAWYLIVIRRMASAPSPSDKVSREESYTKLSANRSDHRLGPAKAVFLMWVWTGAPELKRLEPSSAILFSGCATILLIVLYLTSR